MGYIHIYIYIYGGLLSSGSCIQGIGGGPELTEYGEHINTFTILYNRVGRVFTFPRFSKTLPC